MSLMSFKCLHSIEFHCDLCTFLLNKSYFFSFWKQWTTKNNICRQNWMQFQGFWTVLKVEDPNIFQSVLINIFDEYYDFCCYFLKNCVILQKCPKGKCKVLDGVQVDGKNHNGVYIKFWSDLVHRHFFTKTIRRTKHC